jgi:hypothetical protein
MLWDFMHRPLICNLYALRLHARKKFHRSLLLILSLLLINAVSLYAEPRNESESEADLHGRYLSSNADAKDFVSSSSLRRLRNLDSDTATRILEHLGWNDEIINHVYENEMNVPWHALLSYDPSFWSKRKLVAMTLALFGLSSFTIFIFFKYFGGDGPYLFDQSGIPTLRGSTHLISTVLHYGYFQWMRRDYWLEWKEFRPEVRKRFVDQPVQPKIRALIEACSKSK